MRHRPAVSRDAAHHGGRALAGSVRIVVLVACATAVIASMLVITDRARVRADRARQAQVTMERIRSITQQADIATLRSRATSTTELALAVRQGFEGYEQVVVLVRRLKALGVPAAQRRPIDRGVGEAYGVAINAMGVARVNPRVARQMALTAVSPALERLARSTGAAAHRQDHVARAALLRSRIATTVSLGIGLLLLMLLGWWLHRQQRGSALAEQARAMERRGEERLHAMIRHSSDVVAVIDPHWEVRWIADSARGVLGYEPDALIGRRLSDLIDPVDAHRAASLLATTLEDSSGGEHTTTLRLRDGAGAYRQLELVAENCVDHALIDGVLLNVRDVSERLHLLEQLHHQAFHDDLTGLANRALLGERLTHALARMRRQPGRPALAFLDLDDFKTINDGLGHSAGDELLEAIARRLEATLRTQDTAARLGGDEFAVLLEDVRGEREALEVAQRVRRALERPVRIAGRDVTVSASIGVACAGPEDSVDTLLRNADVAMYAAKQTGKGRVAAFAPEMHRQVLDRFERIGAAEAAEPVDPAA